MVVCSATEYPKYEFGGPSLTTGSLGSKLKAVQRVMSWVKANSDQKNQNNMAEDEGGDGLKVTPLRSERILNAIREEESASREKTTKAVELIKGKTRFHVSIEWTMWVCGDWSAKTKKTTVNLNETRRWRMHWTGSFCWQTGVHWLQNFGTKMCWRWIHSNLRMRRIRWRVGGCGPNERLTGDGTRWRDQTKKG